MRRLKGEVLDWNPLINNRVGNICGTVNIKMYDGTLIPIVATVSNYDRKTRNTPFAKQNRRFNCLKSQIT